MQLVLKNQLRGLSKKEYVILRLLCRHSKNLYNTAIYNARQYYFTKGNYLDRNSNYFLVKTNENYQLLDINIANRIINDVDHCFKSFFSKLKKTKNQQQADQVSIPGYQRKDAYSPLQISVKSSSKFQNFGFLVIPFSREFIKVYPNTQQIRIPFPSVLSEKTIRSVRIIPKQNANFFDVEYVYEQPQEILAITKKHALAIDLNVSNLAACINSKDGASFIVDGRNIKSINRFWNNETARLKCIAGKQGIKSTTKRIATITQKRNNQVRDAICKATRYIVNYCIDHEIGIIVVGHTPDSSQQVYSVKPNNDHFTPLPLGILRRRLRYLCQRYGLVYFEQEESYTSDASFLDDDAIPFHSGQQIKFDFSGKRIPWRLYKTKNGKIINADINAAANILKKSKCIHGCSLSEVGRGLVASPKRIRLI